MMIDEMDVMMCCKSVGTDLSMLDIDDFMTEISHLKKEVALLETKLRLRGDEGLKREDVDVVCCESSTQDSELSLTLLCYTESKPTDTQDTTVCDSNQDLQDDESTDQTSTESLDSVCNAGEQQQTLQTKLKMCSDKLIDFTNPMMEIKTEPTEIKTEPTEIKTEPTADEFEDNHDDGHNFILSVSMANKKEAKGEERGRRKERGGERRKDERGDKQRRHEVREQVRRKECRGNERRQKERKERRSKGQRGKDTKIKQGGKGRPNNYNLWKEERMKGALHEYKEGVKKGITVSVHLLSRAWGVPRSTLQRRISGKVTGSEHVSGRKPYLPEEAERELAATLKTLAQRGFPFTERDVQQVAFDFAAKNNISGFSKTTGRAGYYWFQNFLKRNLELGMRKPEVLSVARAAGLSKEVVSQWFNQYESLLVELGIEGTPSHIWNCDESRLKDQFSSTKVVGQVGQPCLELCAGEKGETITCLAAFNAEGTYSRTMIIFKGTHVRSEWLQGCPENTSVRCSDNGWITSDLFLEWGQMFIQSLPRDDHRPHLLLLDVHSSHVYNLEFIKLLKSKNVHIMCYPAHTTHALQPADKALFKSLKHHWDQEGRKWTRMMAGQKLSRMEFFAVFSRAWAKAATIENAQAGFRGTGMFPLNKDILPETAFAPSKTTDRVLPSTLPSPPTRPQSLPTPPTTPQSLPPPPTGPWSPLLTLTHSARQPSALLSGHQPSYPPARPQSPADPPARPQSPASLTPQLPVEPLYVFPEHDKVVFEEVVLEDVPEEDNDRFNQFTPQEETHSQDKGPSTSTSVRSVTFTDLISVPQRERAIRKRVKPPSYNLTSEQHIEYIKTKKSSSKQPAKQASK